MCRVWRVGGRADVVNRLRAVQGYLAHTSNDLCVGTYGGPMGMGFSDERGTPVKCGVWFLGCRVLGAVCSVWGVGFGGKGVGCEV